MDSPIGSWLSHMGGDTALAGILMLLKELKIVSYRLSPFPLDVERKVAWIPQHTFP